MIIGARPGPIIENFSVEHLVREDRWNNKRFVKRYSTILSSLCNTLLGSGTSKGSSMTLN